VRIGFIHVTHPLDVHYWPPLSFGSLKSYLHKHLGDAVTMKHIRKPGDYHVYDIIGISATSQDFNRAKRIAKDIKEKNPSAIVVLGGSHVTWLPKTMTHDFDFGVMGEGEQTFLELVMVMMDGGGHPVINGLAFKLGDSWGINPPRALIEPLDYIPFPFREPSPQPHLFTSRGCFYRCKFCSSSAFWKKVRLHSADYVVDEIEYLVSIGAFGIPIQDDIFVLSKERLVNIVEKIKRKGLDKKFTASIAVRANLIDDELCTILKNFQPIKVANFGAESGSDRILARMGKGVTVAQNQEALNRLHAVGIPSGLSFIAGYPSETEEELRMTCEFIQRNIRDKKLHPRTAINILTPFPGTAVWDDAVRDGKIDLETFNWDRLGVFASFISSRAKDLDNWINLRRQNDSIYLNEETLPQERLYEILKEHEKEIRKGGVG